MDFSFFLRSSLSSHANKRINRKENWVAWKTQRIQDVILPFLTFIVSASLSHMKIPLQNLITRPTNVTAVRRKIHFQCNFILMTQKAPTMTKLEHGNIN